MIVTLDEGGGSAGHPGVSCPVINPDAVMTALVPLHSGVAATDEIKMSS